MLKNSAVRQVDVLLMRFPELEYLRDSILHAVELMAECHKKDGRILVCGNGGSAADSLHITGEMMKSFVLKRPVPQEIKDAFWAEYPEDAEYFSNNLQSAICCHSLVCEAGLMTAYANDNTADLVFAQQVLGYGRKGDILIAISTSGNSANVLNAAKVARVLGVSVLSLTGRSGGKLKELSDVLLNVPSDITSQIQELHLPLYHAICLSLESELFAEKA